MTTKTLISDNKKGNQRTSHWRFNIIDGNILLLGVGDIPMLTFS